MNFPFVKGHGTQNDFILLPDLSGSVHGELAAEVVARVCDRRAGIGGDGVLRVMRGKQDAAWYMDYRNADGSAGEMCGNGLRVFARYLEATRLVDTQSPLSVDTADGVKEVAFCDDGEISVAMGVPVRGDGVKISVGSRTYDAVAVDIGNPHAVVFVESLDEAGALVDSPRFNPDDFPQGVNVEFVVRRGPSHLALRVFERGVGETKSCGTGACAAVVAAVSTQTPEWRTVEGERIAPGDAVLDPGNGPRDGYGAYAVDVAGGRLTVTWAAGEQIHLKGPAVLVAEGVWRS